MIPKSLYSLSKKIKFRFNRTLGHFPIEILELRLPKLLSISQYKLTRLPVNLNKVENLSSFIVSSNCIKVGFSFQFPSSVKIVDIYYNNIADMIYMIDVIWTLVTYYIVA